MKIIADDGPSGRIEEMLAPIKERDGVVVFIERKVNHRFRQECLGLDDVLAHAPSGVPVVMLAWQSPVMLADDPRWHAALGYPNVIFRRLPEAIIEIVAAIDEATERKQTPDPLAIALLGAKVFVEQMGILDHNLFSASRSPERMATWIEQARKHLGDKTQDELIEIVKQPRKTKDAVGQFAGQEFPDVCVDVEETLFTSDGAFRPATLDYAVTLANGRPITIWTGGELETACKMVRQAKIPYKLIPKQLLAGAIVHAVVDDLPEADFWKTYGVRYGTYHQV